jgi:hypothetical protein
MNERLSRTAKMHDMGIRSCRSPCCLLTKKRVKEGAMGDKGRYKTERKAKRVTARDAFKTQIQQNDS